MYVNYLYPPRAVAGRVSSLIAIIYGGKTSNYANMADCTSKIHNTNLYRRNAVINLWQKGYVRQDVVERYGSGAYADIRGAYNGSAGIVNGVWSTDSVAESNTIEFN